MAELTTNEKASDSRQTMIACICGLSGVVCVWWSIYAKWPFPLITLIQWLGFSADPVDMNPIALLVYMSAVITSLAAAGGIAALVYSGCERLRAAAR